MSEATTTMVQRGEAGSGCVNGWTTPAPGTVLGREPLDVIRGQMGVTDEFQIVEMRYFTGPEVPWIIEPRPPLVERWYVKAQLVPAFTSAAASVGRIDGTPLVSPASPRPVSRRPRRL